jgi:K+-sensing histidine kinase KdpD
LGFLFATAYALVVSPVACGLFRYNHLPRFTDVFLLGIVLTVYLFTWEGAAYLLVISALIYAWVLPPYGNIRVDAAADWYRLISFTLVSLFLICLIARLKARHDLPAAPGEGRVHGHARS